MLLIDLSPKYALHHIPITNHSIDLTFKYIYCSHSSYQFHPNAVQQFGVYNPNMSNTVQCHYCGQERDKNYLHGFIAKCCIKRCSKYFCIHCIRSHFNPEFEETNYRKDTWICYFCQDSCSCLKCKNQELNEMERKNKRKRNVVAKQNEESAELHSASNISLSNNVNSLSANSQNIVLQKVQIAIEVAQKPGVQDEQQIQKNIIQHANIHEQMMIPADDMILLPPYLKRIAQRKNMFYQFMVRQGKEKSSKKMKQLISNEIKRRRGDTDGIDLEEE